MDWLKKLVEYYCSHQGAIIGGIIGLVTGIAFLVFGFFKVLFIALCVMLGYYIGKNASEGRNFIKDIKDKLFSPKIYK